MAKYALLSEYFQHVASNQAQYGLEAALGMALEAFRNTPNLAKLQKEANAVIDNAAIIGLLEIAEQNKVAELQPARLEKQLITIISIE